MATVLCQDRQVVQGQAVIVDQVLLQQIVDQAVIADQVLLQQIADQLLQVVQDLAVTITQITDKVKIITCQETHHHLQETILLTIAVVQAATIDQALLRAEAVVQEVVDQADHVQVVEEDDFLIPYAYFFRRLLRRSSFLNFYVVVSISLNFIQRS